MLHLELDSEAARKTIAPLTLHAYQSVSVREIEPHVLLSFVRSKHQVFLAIESAKGLFRIYTSRAELVNQPEIEAFLRGQAEFVDENEVWARNVARKDIRDFLSRIALGLANLPVAIP